MAVTVYSGAQTLVRYSSTCGSYCMVTGVNIAEDNTDRSLGPILLASQVVKPDRVAILL